MPRASNSTNATPTTTTSPAPKTFNGLLTMIGCDGDIIREINAVGLVSLEDFLDIDKDQITTLCKTIRRGGTLSLPLKVERRLNLILSEVKICRYTNRPLDSLLEATLETLRTWTARKAEMSGFKDPIDGSPVASSISKNWAKGFEQLQHWIGRHVDDDTGIPLAFAIRLGPHDASDYKSTNYSSLFEEFAKRTRLCDDQNVDFEWAKSARIKVWNILYSIFKDHPALEYMKTFQGSKDGPSAYAALRNHFLGMDTLDHLTMRLESEYANLTYTQDTKRWDFEKYVAKHVELYNLSQDLVPLGYCGIDPATRVRRFLRGIKTNVFDSVKNQIWADESLKRDFDRTVNAFKNFIADRDSYRMQGTAEIAAVSHSPGKRKSKGNGRPGKRKKSNNSEVAAVNVEDRYYTQEEYRKLSSEEKQRLRELRDGRKGGKRRKGPRKDATDAQAIGKAMADAFVNAVRGSQSTNEQKVEGSKPVDQSSDPVTNRNNPALRPKKKD